MNVLTLKLGSMEQTLDDWGLSIPTMWYRSRAPGELQFDFYNADPAIQAVAPEFEWGCEIELWEGRSGSGTEWTGGTRRFVGYRIDQNGIASGDDRSLSLTFLDAYNKLQRTTYQMTWRNSAGKYYSPRCFLFQNAGNSTVPWTNWQTKDQINDAITFAHTQCGIAIQAGTVDPLMYQPIYPCRSPKISEVIELSLTSLPDAITWMDYTTNDGAGNPLPTLHVRQRQNCTAANLPYSDGTKHLSTRIKSREDLVVPQVVFNYQQTEEIDGVTWNEPGIDAYPIGSTGLAENAVVEAIDLRGFSRNDATCQVVSTALTDPGTFDFWKDKDKTLADDTVSSGDVVDGDYTVVDHTGADIDTDVYAYEFKNGTAAPWAKDGTNTPIKVIEATIQAKVSYTKEHPSGSTLKTDDVTDHPVSTRIRLTNSPAGARTYSQQASGATAEYPSPNLAYLFWCSVNNVPINIVGGVVTPPAIAPSITNAYNLQWDGQHIIVEDTISTFYTPFNVLNLTGGAANWAAMHAAIYEIEYDFFEGTTTVNFGPNKKMTAKQFFTQMMMFRTRVMWDDPNVRSTGMDASGSGTALGKDTRVQDTTAAAPATKQVDTVAIPPAGGESTGAQLASQRDMKNNGGQWTMGTFVSGALQNSGSSTKKDSIQLTMDDLAPVGETNFVDIKFRVVTYKIPDPEDPSSCVDKYRYIACSQELDGTGPY